MVTFYKILQMWYDQKKVAKRKIRNIHQVRTSNKRSRSRPQKLSRRVQRILALLKYSDEDKVKKAHTVHTAEEELVNVRCTFSSSTVKL